LAATPPTPLWEKQLPCVGLLSCEALRGQNRDTGAMLVWTSGIASIRILSTFTHAVILRGCRGHGDNNFRAILTGSKSITFVPEFEDEKSAAAGCKCTLPVLISGREVSTFGQGMRKKKFEVLSNLIRHTKTVHNGRKDYEYERCEKKFGRRSNSRTYIAFYKFIISSSSHHGLRSTAGNMEQFPTMPPTCSTNLRYELIKKHEIKFTSQGLPPHCGLLHVLCFLCFAQKEMASALLTAVEKFSKSAGLRDGMESDAHDGHKFFDPSHRITREGELNNFVLRRRMVASYAKKAWVFPKVALTTFLRMRPEGGRRHQLLFDG
ncbi:unnamed protein product, partial [Trichogramma brassicae]